jgi:hypothetical protein
VSEVSYELFSALRNQATAQQVLQFAVGAQMPIVKVYTLGYAIDEAALTLKLV